MQASEDLLRLLARNDEHTVRAVLQDAPVAGAGARAGLDLKTYALVRLGALLSVGATTDSYSPAVDLARAAGATDPELVGVLTAIGPAVGSARVVAASPRLAIAIGYDLDDL